MNDASSRDFVVVCVAPGARGAESDLMARLSRMAARAGLPTGAARTLGPGAVEISLPSPTAEGIEVLRHALAALGDEADTALLPAANRKKRLLVSDMDSTMIGQECIDELADFAGLKAEISAITERAMRGELDFDGALKTRVEMLAGLPLTALEQCFAERIRLSPGAATVVRTMADHGARCVLVSGGFTFFTGRVAELAGFHSHHANLLLDSGDRLKGEVREPILGREAKLQALDREAKSLGLSRKDAIALGDGANDLSIISAAGLGIAYLAKPVVAAKADAAINLSDLTTALYFQGYSEAEFSDPAAPDRPAV
jgi:phosphoserine phosphatase